MNDYVIDNFSEGMSNTMLDLNKLDRLMKRADIDNLTEEELREEAKAMLNGEPSPRVYKLMKQLMGAKNVREIKRET